MNERFDVIIIGAGAMGSAAAYYFSKRKQRVLLLEQFELDHRRGSSFGYSRIIRYAYDNPEYVELAKDCFPLWFAAEDSLGEQLYVKTGGIDFGPAADEMLQATIESLQSGMIEHELLSVDEAHRRFPQFRFGGDFRILYQPDSGFIKASRAVRGHIQLARQRGAILKDKTVVADIAINQDSVEVDTSAGSFSAGALVVTAGSWARSLLADTGLDLPLTVLRCQLNFMSTSRSSQYDSDSCPVWIAHVSSLFPETLYGIPSHAGSGFKVAFHGGAPHYHPSEINYDPDPENVDAMQDFLRSHIPGLADAPVRESRICLYTQTPDEHFIVDRHPQYAHVLIGAGFSGHGFKFSAIIGKMLSDLALDGATPHNDRLFKISRFSA